MKAAIISVTVFLAIFCFESSLVEASCNVLSTAKIIGKLCYIGDNKNNQTLIDGFFGCYDQAPGKQQFVDCQTEAFGAPMNTKDNVAATCKTPTKIPAYSSCLKREFSEAEIDMDATVKTINACQSKVMGIKDSWFCRD